MSKVNDIFDGNQQNTEDGESGPLDFSKISLIGDDAVKENFIDETNKIFGKDVIEDLYFVLLNKRLVVTAKKLYALCA